MASLLLAAPDAQAGSYTDAPSGGTTPATITPATSATITPAAAATSTSPTHATATAAVTPMSPNGIPSYIITISPGTFTDTFTWTPASGQTLTTDLPPSCVIVDQGSFAAWGVRMENGTGTGSGKADCGLPGGTVTTSTYGQADGPSQSLSATYYSVQTSPGSSFSASCSPTALFTGTTGTTGLVSGEAMVGGNASVYPITISVGGTTPDSSGNPNILVGQQCTATINGIPSALLNNTANPPVYQWSVSGTTFESWGVVSDANGQSHTVEVDAIPATNSTSWYWNDPSSTTETISCTVTVTPPAGEGSPFDLTVTAPKPVSVQLPGWFAYEAGGYMQVSTTAPNTNNAITLNAGPGQSGGMTWTANVMGSALFASGTIELVQLVTPDESYITYTGVGVPGVTHNDPVVSSFKLLDIVCCTRAGTVSDSSRASHPSSRTRASCGQSGLIFGAKCC